MPAILDLLPSLYRGLLPAFFSRQIPAETKADCGRCTMCATHCGEAVEPIDGVSRLFRPDTKCCTFHPRLPNYLAGAILGDSSPELAEGRRRILAKIDGRVGLGPQWLRPPATFSLLYSSSRQFFGRASSLRCPYFEQASGSCSIWPWRESVCSTFFCRHVAGADGHAFWMALKRWLALVEIQLSRWALFQIHPDFVLAGLDREDPTNKPLSADDLDGRPLSEKDYRKLWGAWASREADFYEACFREVSAQSSADLTRMLGLDGTIELAALEKRHAAATDARLPRTLRFDPSATVKWLRDGSVALGAYSEYEALALPGSAYELLVAFDGTEPVEAVRQRLRQSRAADLDEGVLLALYQQRVLVEP
ncbi:MAG: hypothetical protein ACOX6T_15950 [Myxococcales bacterium]|jgi:hypothetical protein